MRKNIGLDPLPEAEPAPADPARLDRDGLDALLGFHIRRAHAAMCRDFNIAFQAFELTQKQAATLWLIGANPGVSQATLAASLRMDRATMMVIIDRLEKAKLALRRRSTSDRRRQELHLTLAGRRMLAQTKVTVASHERAFTSRFSERELADLIAALARLWA
ncbi:MAG: winged helix-turn-helix transcriptional regulator [Hyphomonadaceae bacterium]|nr:winged helix-turn-helix transcriptional regulator [Hyphomonadaceae bacterium]